MNASAGQPHMKAACLANSISLCGTVAIGISVMIGAGIFAMRGQTAELMGPLFLLSVIAGAIVTACSTYTYIKKSNAYTLLFAALLVVSGPVVGGVPAIASGPANGQQVTEVTDHHVPYCDQPSQKTHHYGSGTHITCAFCVPIQQPSEQVVPAATGLEIFLQDFAVTLGRNVPPDPFPPKITSTA